MIFIHRGKISKKTKENSLEGFKLSIAKGLNIETDIHFISDGSPVCYHDFSLLRINNLNRQIKDLKFREIRKFRILELKKLIKILKKKTKILIEVKPNLNKKTLNLFYKIIKRNIKNIIIISFNEKNLIKLHNYKKKIKLGLCFNKSDKFKFIDSKKNKKHINFLVLDKSQLNNKKIDKIKKITSK